MKDMAAASPSLCDKPRGHIIPSRPTRTAPASTSTRRSNGSPIDRSLKTSPCSDSCPALVPFLWVFPGFGHRLWVSSHMSKSEAWRNRLQKQEVLKPVTPVCFGLLLGHSLQGKLRWLKGEAQRMAFQTEVQRFFGRPAEEIRVCCLSL